MLIKNNVSRRKLLEVSSSAMLLYPLIQILKLSEAKAAGAILPRVVFTHSSCGAFPKDFWNMATSGPLGTLSKIMAPLDDHKADLIQLRGLCTRGDTNHDGAPAQVLAGWGKRGGVAMPGRETSLATPYSLDQMLGDRWGDKTQKKLILLGSGTSVPTQNGAISYNRSGAPVACVDNPKASFDSIFGGFNLSSGGSSSFQLAATSVATGRKRVIDYLRGDIKKISAQLGEPERKMFEAHVTTLDDIAKEIIKQEGSQTSMTPGSPSPSPSSGTVGTPDKLDTCSPNSITGLPVDIENYAAVRGLNNKIMVQALACGITRVGVIAFAVSDTTVDYGNGGSYHLDSHGAPDDLAIAQKAFMGSIAELATMMKAVKTANGTLFDETLISFSSDLGEDPNAHIGVNVPAFLLGRLGGKLKGGRQIAFPYTPGDWATLTNGMDYNRFLLTIAALLGEGDISVIGNTAYKGTIPEILG